MRIVWQDEAERDLDRIADYILEDDPAAALRLIYTNQGGNTNSGRTPQHRAHRPCGRDTGTCHPKSTLYPALSDCGSGDQDSGRHARIEEMARYVSVTSSSVKWRHLEDAIHSAVEDVRAAGYEVAHFEWS